MSTPAENARKRFVASDRDRIVAEAVRLRKIAPEDAESHKRHYDENPEGWGHLLTAPVEQGGLMAGLVLSGDHPTEYPSHWLGAGTRPSGAVVFEDSAAAVEGAAGAAPQVSPDDRVGGLPAASAGNITIGND